MGYVLLLSCAVTEGWGFFEGGVALGVVMFSSGKGSYLEVVQKWKEL